MLKDEWPILFSKDFFYGLVKVVLQNLDVFYCVDLTVALNQSTYAVRPNAPPKHNRN